jgi:hypothetical protein
MEGELGAEVIVNELEKTDYAEMISCGPPGYVK